MPITKGHKRRQNCYFLIPSGKLATHYIADILLIISRYRKVGTYPPTKIQPPPFDENMQPIIIDFRHTFLQHDSVLC